MKLSLWGWKIEIYKANVFAEAPVDFFIPPPANKEKLDLSSTLPGEVTPGYETFEGELQNEEDSVEEKEWREEQNWLNKRKQRDGTI